MGGKARAYREGSAAVASHDPTGDERDRALRRIVGDPRTLLRPEGSLTIRQDVFELCDGVLLALASGRIDVAAGLTLNHDLLGGVRGEAARPGSRVVGRGLLGTQWTG